MIRNPEEMFSEFVSCDEFKRRTGLQEDVLPSIKLRERTNDALTACIQALVKEFSKNSEATRTVVRSIYAVINTQGKSVEKDAE